jgi:hypothetical protein
MLLNNRAARSGFMLLLACYSLAFSASAQNNVRSIQIESGVASLGESLHENVTILHENGRFIREGRPIDAALVQSLVAALRAQPIVKPTAKSLGITPAWLSEHLPDVESSWPTKFSDASPSQRRLFESSYTDPRTIAKLVPDLFNYTSVDYDPYAKVEIVFDDGSKLSATSNSVYAYMIPWALNGSHKANNFNVAISRAVLALLPAKSPDKEQLVGVDFDSELAEALMYQIENRWNMLGVEDRAGSVLTTLRQFYTVMRADINHSIYFGWRYEPKGPHETNLQVTLHKPSFPANLQEDLVLQYEQGKVVGLDEFLRNGPKYEAFALSVPWLNKYLREHPQETMTLMYTHLESFGNHAMQSFALDMKARGREDLIPAVSSQQSEIALLKIGYVYWLLFPDHHMMLWSFDGPSGFLKWKQSDFPAGKCDAYYARGTGGCSGREVTPEGTLVPEADQK